jgi:hypothetical protein
MHLRLPITTKTVNATTDNFEPGVLSLAFVGLIFMSILLHVAPRTLTGKWEEVVYFRADARPVAIA